MLHTLGNKTLVTVRRVRTMKLLIFIIAWLILLLICWPLALLVLVLAPLLWLLSLPFRLLGICIEATFA